MPSLGRSCTSDTSAHCCPLVVSPGNGTSGSGPGSSDVFVQRVRGAQLRWLLLHSIPPESHQRRGGGGTAVGGGGGRCAGWSLIRGQRPQTPWEGFLRAR